MIIQGKKVEISVTSGTNGDTVIQVSIDGNPVGSPIIIDSKGSVVEKLDGGEWN